MSGSSRGIMLFANVKAFIAARSFVLASERASIILYLPSAFFRTTRIFAMVPGSRCPARRELVFLELVALAIIFPRSHVNMAYSLSASPRNVLSSTIPSVKCSVTALLYQFPVLLRLSLIKPPKALI